MSANQFSTVVNSLSLPKNDKKWFPLWLFRYASHLNADRNVKLEVTSESVIGFLRGLLQKGVPAWQRHQAATAIRCYRTEVLKTEEPSLDEICAKLAQRAAIERDSGEAMSGSQRRLIDANIDRSAPKCVQQMQTLLRTAHYATQFCDALAGSRIGYSYGARAAGPQRCDNHANLYACDE